MQKNRGVIMSEIRREICSPGVLRYDRMASPEAFFAYPKLLNALLTEARAEFRRMIRTSPKQARFETVVEPYLHMGDSLSQLYGFIDSLNGTNNSRQTRGIIEAFQPKLVEYSNEISLSKPYYKLLRAVKKRGGLSPDQKRSVELLLRDMEISGVHAGATVGAKIQKINKELTKLSEKFENNVIDSRKEFFYEFSDDADLKEVPESDLHEAAAEAKRRNFKSNYVFTLSQPSVQAILKFCSNRAVRELFYKKNNSLATRGAHDNRKLARQILSLRHRKANLLGFPNYVEYVLQERMASSPSAILKLMREIFPRAKRKAQGEMDELRKFASLPDMQEWDRAYVSEQFRRKKFQIEEKVLKEYFPLPEVLAGLFLIVKKIYGIELKEVRMKSYDPTVRTFNVFRDGVHIAYYVADFFARPEKRGGAWCNDLRRGFVTTQGEKVLPVIINVMNFALPTKKAPSLLTHRDVETLFHEFGHALHAMLSSASYPNLNGFHTEWDFVEFPSQFFENWCWEHSVVDLFSRHYRTGKPLSAKLLSTLRRTKTFLSGYSVTRQNEFAFLDLLLHLSAPPKTVAALDKQAISIVNKYTVLPKWPGYQMYASFGHIFAGGYAAGYYSYLWAEILEADCFEFVQKKGILSPKIMRTYARKILEPGAKQSGISLFQKLLKRPPNVNAFLRKHAL